ncbi:MAG: response regulator [Rhodospirillales bacterium]|nr:response regulator [Rhodospirillales bacterium]
MTSILIVDDDELAVSELGEYLVGKGYEVRTAANGELATQAMLKEPSDLVISDIIMPEKEGIELIIDLRKQFALLPIIAVSGGGRTEYLDYLDLALSAGASRAYSKPLDLRELHQAIQDLLSGEGQAAG